jgi:hypothetical protein
MVIAFVATKMQRFGWAVLAKSAFHFAEIEKSIDFPSFAFKKHSGYNPSSIL